MMRLFASLGAAAYNSAKERHPMKTTTTDKASKAKPAAAGTAKPQRKTKPSTVELLLALRQFKWDFEAMKRV